MKELFPGIFQVRLTLKGFGPGSVNLYVLKDASHLTLIDTGWDTPDSVEFLKAQLAEAGLNFSNIHRVLLTHCHGDHLGMINRLKAQNNARIYLHQAELEIVRIRYNTQNDYWQKTEEFLVTHGLPPGEFQSIPDTLPNISKLTPPDICLQGGETISVGQYSLQVINTPGHSPGHVAYYEPHHKFIFSGDILLPTIATNAAAHVQHMHNPLQQYADSLKNLYDLEISTVMPGHQNPFSGHRPRILELLALQQTRSLAVQKVIESPGEKTVFQVAQLIPWIFHHKTVAFDQLPAWDKRLALMQTLAHLEFLASSQKLLRFQQSGKIYYRRS